MDRTISEKKMLKRLGIPDWRHMSRDKIMTFVNSIPHMDPEVAKAAIEQFPNFSTMATDIVQHIDSAFAESIKSDDIEAQEIYNTKKDTLDFFKSRLSDPDISNEEKSELINAIVQILYSMDESHGNNQKFKLTMSGILAVVGVAAFGISSMLLGNNVKISSDDNDDIDVFYDE